MIRRVLLAALLLAVSLLGGCSDASGGNNRTGIKLDGSPRVPTDAGIATVATAARIEIDGKRTYRVSRQLLCFSTVTLEPVPLVQREGQYVHVGVRDGTVVWVASIGAVLRAEGAPPVVYYRGTLRTLVGHTATFKDGTVLRLAPEIPKLDPDSRLLAEIDPTADLVRRVTVG
ncbi:MAG: hypothetical protein QOF60_399 [Actinomycetota bacterium]|nr:hypothetical protein [Actinomycetota bacterium]